MININILHQFIIEPLKRELIVGRNFFHEGTGPSKGAGPTSTSRIGRTKEFRPRASETWEGMPPEFMWKNQGQE